MFIGALSNIKSVALRMTYNSLYPNGSLRTSLLRLTLRRT